MTRLNLGCGPHTLDGFDNLDASTGWQFEDGLGDYQDGSVEGITVSHALMYVPVEEWPAVFAEFARVLKPGGVIRVTEDSTADPESERHGGFPGVVTLTSPAVVRAHLKAAGLTARLQDPDSSGFKDRSLIQTKHGAPPKVFHIEGRKPR